MSQYLESLDFPPPAAPKAETPVTELKRWWFDTPAWVHAEVEVTIATYQAYLTLYYAFIALMAVAGLDKFLHLLTTWDTYVSPAMVSFFHMSPGAITVFAGLIELAVAAAIALKPRIGSWCFTIWMLLVALNLMTMQGHADMVLSNLALAAAGFAFTRLAAECN